MPKKKKVALRWWEFHNWQLFAGLGIMTLGSAFGRVSDYIVKTYYPNRPSPQDLLFDIFPYIENLEYIADIVLIIAILSFGYYLYKHKWNWIGRDLGAIGIMYMIRAFLNTVTPLGKPNGNESSHGILKEYYTQYGMFPSGHVGIMTLFFFLIDDKEIAFKRFMFFLLVAEIVTMLLSHGHYSIDIFGALMLGYIVSKIVKRHGKWLVRE